MEVILLSSASALITELVIETIARGGWLPAAYWAAEHYAAAIANLILFSLSVLCVWIVLPVRYGLIILGAIFSLVAYISKSKLAVLGESMYPSDLLLFRQSNEVAAMEGNRWLFFTSLLSLPIAFGLLLFGATRVRRITWTYRIFVTVFSLSVLYKLVSLPDYTNNRVRTESTLVNQLFDAMHLEYKSWDPYSNLYDNGVLLSFLFCLPAYNILEPIGYTKRFMHDLVGIASTDTYQSSNETESTRVQNMIVILSESFWDPSQMPGVQFNPDPVQFDTRNIIVPLATGTAISPVFGGYTCNAEYEILTGFSMAFNPAGSIPYQQYIKESVPSLADFFSSKGYFSVALHPYAKNFWNRNHVFRQMGFGKFISIEDFNSPEMAGDYISDISFADKILDTVGKASQPLFIFAISIGNHMPYNYDHYPQKPTVDVFPAQGINLEEDELFTLRNYAKGVSQATKALQILINYFSAENQPETVIFFVGDHLPPLGRGFELYQKTGFIQSVDPSTWDTATLDRMHSVPYFAWSNRQLRTKLPNSSISMNYLSVLISRLAGLPVSPYQRLLDNCQMICPILRRSTANESKAKCPELNLIQYDQIQGLRYVDSSFFR